MKEYNGGSPQNARIKINYTGKKPKVSFSYPVNPKESRTVISMLPYIFLLWFLINTPLLIYVSLNNIILEDYPYRSLDEYNKTDYNSYVKYYTQKEKIDYTYDLVNKKTSNILKEFSPLRDICLYLYIYIVPSLIYFIFKKKWDKWYPDLQAFLSSKKYRKFKSKDIQELRGEYFIELPVFNNVLCDFNATKEFSKYLAEFEILEHKFYYYNKTKSKLTKKKIRRKNEYIFYARWYFKEKPKEGYLEVIYY